MLKKITCLSFIIFLGIVAGCTSSSITPESKSVVTLIENDKYPISQYTVVTTILPDKSRSKFHMIADKDALTKGVINSHLGQITYTAYVYDEGKSTKAQITVTIKKDEEVVWKNEQIVDVINQI